MGDLHNKPEKSSFIETSAANIGQYFEKGFFDYIFHFGEYSRVEQSLSEDLLTFENTTSTFPNILNYVKGTDTKLIYSGSSTKFSPENDVKDLSPYTYAKKANTELLKAYAHWYNIKYAIVYFYNVYGGNERGSGKYSTVVAKFKRLKEQGVETLPVTSPGTQLRNFTHIDDVISALRLIAMSGEGDGFGIGSDTAISILELCEAFGCLPELMPGHPSNRQSACIETKKTKKLGWEEKNSLINYINGICDN